MSNISDEIDALAIIADTTISELARTRLALAEARRLNAELVEALIELRSEHILRAELDPMAEPAYMVRVRAAIAKLRNNG